ncbi:hypothetical protein LPMP_170010 [Leishmania panamensis]|uniref:Uncharacterized protein n=1 Tax=Leishmania panamensis TaxID=5679 RepID=A0A088RP57_LEIPA|nr:hypothetical protein LPMP_170010 [Leishmania panamensis]AIN97039.1 hypothetical protein LPMP_170010 [Leishmania panamensis]
MDRAATSDARARSSLSKAQEHLRNGDVKEAIDALSSHLRFNQVTPIGFECLELLADLCLTHEKLEPVKLIEVLRRCRSGLRGSQHVEESVQRIVDSVMIRIRQMCARAKERAEAMQSTASEGDQMLAALSGVSLAALAEKRHIIPCHAALRRLIRHFCGNNTIGFAKKLTFIYNKTVRQFLSMCKEFNTPACVLDISTAVSRAVSHMALDHLHDHDDAASRNAVQELLKERTAFLTSTAAVTETVETLCCLLNDICSLRQYGGAFDVLSCLKRVCDKVQRNEELIDVVSGAYETMSDIFWTCSVYNYHAYCLSIAASMKRQEKRGPLAARAVLASLCVSEGDMELDPFGRYREKSARIDELFESPVTTKTSLIANLKTKGVYTLASPEIVKIAASLEDPNFSDFTCLHKSVTALAAANSDLARYGNELHKMILRYQLEILSGSCNYVEVLSLAAYNGNLTAVEYVNNIEPVILGDESVSVDIDTRTNTLSFRDSSKAKMLSYFNKIVANVDTVPASSVATTSGRYSDFTNVAASSPKRQVVPSTTDLEVARARSTSIYALQKACMNSKAERIDEAKKSEDKKRERAVAERREQEEAKKEEMRKAYLRKLYSEYTERQRQERGKDVLRKLRIKYPGFKVDESIVYRSAAGFEDELTRLLAAYKRRGVDNDHKEILQANLYERALRVMEIPKRKEYDAQNSERTRAERVAARENYLAEHRREYDRRQSEKAVLAKFLRDAEEFEHTWRKRANIDKPSKRDEQQRLLEEEMRRLGAE